MSVDAYQGDLVTFEYVGATGLTGTLGFRLLSATPGTLIARTTAGITEFPAGSGCYKIQVAAPGGGEYTALWDTGVVSPATIAVEDLAVFPWRTGKVQPSTPFAAKYVGVSGLTGTLALRIIDAASSTVLPRSTAGITEYPAGSGLYHAQPTSPAAAGPFTRMWDTGSVSPTTTAYDDFTVLPVYVQESLIFDPAGESSGTPLDVSVDPYSIEQMSFPAAPVDTRWAEPVDADGNTPVAHRYLNAEVNLQIGVHATAAVDLAGAAAALAAKIAKLEREGGTLQRTLPTGVKIIFDILPAGATIDLPTDIAYAVGNYISAPIKLTRKPFGRGPEQAYTAHTETALAAAVFVETAVPGDVPALGRLVITDAQGQNRKWAAYGVQSRRYDPSADAALYYEAETRTRFGTASVVGVGGASGGGATVLATLASGWAQILSTQADGGGNHHRHAGRYRVLARVFSPATNIGTVSLALDWAIGDYQFVTRNTQVDIQRTEFFWGFALLDLGVVSIPVAVAGAQRWEGRIVGKTSWPGDQVYIDGYTLIPIDEGSGEASGTAQLTAAPSLLARDEFAQTPGALNGDALPIGGTWATTGGTGDFQTAAAGGGIGATTSLQRTHVSDAAGLNNGRFALASGTASLVTAAVAATFSSELLADASQGLVARYVDTDNFLLGSVDLLTGDVTVTARVAGVDLMLATMGRPFTGRLPFSLTVDDTGGWQMYAGTEALFPKHFLFHSSLAPGGALAAGKAGLFDQQTSAVANTRTVKNFSVYAPPVNAAIYANQPLEVRADRVIRKDPSGTVWSEVAFEGDLLMVPCAGPENRSVRVIALASRGGVGAADPVIDDLTAQLFVTPRYLIVPS